jgi:tetratricopeptide (TPR) repeat protein/O-antigen ligase
VVSQRRARGRGVRDVEMRAEHEAVGTRVRSAGLVSLWAFVFLVPLVVDPAADWSFTIPKALLTHALAFVLAGAVIAQFARYGRAAIAGSWLSVPVVVFLLVNTLATVFAADRYIALFGTHARMLGLATIASWTVAYIAVLAFVRTSRDVVAVVGAALGGGVVMLCYEALQLLRLDPFNWTLDAAVRPISTNGQATSLGSYLMVLAVASLAMALVTDGLGRRGRAVLVIASALFAIGSALTGTRSSLLGLGSGLAVLVGLMSLKSVDRTRRLVSVATAGVGVLALIVLIVFTPLGARLFQTAPVSGDSEEAAVARLDTATLDVRAVLYGVALDAVRERPLLGFGPDNFVVAMARFRPDTGPNEARFAYATSAHGWIGQTAVGSGLLGLASFVAIIVLAGVATLRAPLSAWTTIPAVAIASHLGTGITTVSDIASDWLVWMCAGVIAVATSGAVGNPRAAAADGRKPRAARKRSMRGVQWRDWALIGVGVAFAISAVSALAASRAAETSRDQRLAGMVDPSIRSALEATSKDAGRAEYWRLLGLAYVSGQRWRDAAVAFDHAIASAPWDARNISDQLQVQLVLTQLGDAAARARARELSDAVVRADPNFPDAQIARATALQFLGDYPAALAAIQRAMTLLPGSPNERWHLLAAQLYAAVGRPADAAAAAESGIAIVGPTVALRMELARALFASGRAQEALTQVDAVLAVDPNNAVARQLRAEIESALRR